MSQLSLTPETSLDLKPTFIPKTITQFLGEISTIGSVSEKMIQIYDLIARLETEISKIDAFKRELPLCMLLMNDAIDALKEVTMFKKATNQPVLEQFMPLSKRTCHEADRKLETDSGDKKNWLSSTQLWNTDNSDTNVYPIPKQNSVKKVVQKKTEEGQDGMINYPHCVTGIKNPNIVMETGGEKLRPPEQKSCRKQRRCWSTELHRRFVSALQQLGGSKVATPKQIRDLMGVDGLTNDEVKSHLQKYRLHTKRHSSAEGHYVETHINSQSASPDGPLLNYTAGGTSTTGGDSMDEGEDEKSDNNCSFLHLRQR